MAVWFSHLTQKVTKAGSLRGSRGIANLTEFKLSLTGVRTADRCGWTQKHYDLSFSKPGMTALSIKVKSYKVTGVE
jgi:hypothetical protein